MAMSSGTAQWRPSISAWAAKYKADPVLIESIMQIESGGNAAAVGPVNSNGTRDYGLMQLNPKGALDAWKANGHPTRDPMNPEHALEVACWFVGICIPAWLKSLKPPEPVTRQNVIIAYNGGAGATRAGKTPTSTIKYLALVEARYAAATFKPDATAVPLPSDSPRTGAADSKVLRILAGGAAAGMALWSAYKALWKHD